MEVAASILKEPPPYPGSAFDGLPSELPGLIMRCLELEMNFFCLIDGATI
jgi:hypothetical protein